MGHARTAPAARDEQARIDVVAVRPLSDTAKLAPWSPGTVTFSDVPEGAAPRRDRMITVSVHEHQLSAGPPTTAQVAISVHESAPMSYTHAQAVGLAIYELAVICGGTGPDASPCAVDAPQTGEMGAAVVREPAWTFDGVPPGILWSPPSLMSQFDSEFLHLVPRWFAFRRTSPAARRLIGDILRSGGISPEGRLVLLISALETFWATTTGRSLRQRKDMPLRYKLAELAQSAGPQRAGPDEETSCVLLPQGSSAWAAQLVSLKNQLAHSGRTQPGTPAVLEELAWQSYTVLHRALLRHLSRAAIAPGTQTP
ncbi:hypothetical protein GCM10010467_20080 [Actinocorallia glomerata]|uniref:ApeA N-terminal domain-containing protein n=3 Tax=Actinomycetes TaxID=1760 RepID=A0ABP6M3E6_9MICC